MRAGRKKQLKLNKGVFIVSRYFGDVIFYLVNIDDHMANFSPDVKEAKKFMTKQQAEWVASFVDHGFVEEI